MAKGSSIVGKGSGDGPAGDNIRLAEVGQALFVKAAGVGILALGISAFLGAGEHVRAQVHKRGIEPRKKA